MKANSACVVYFWMKPNTQDMYVGKSMRGFDVRMKEHYSNIVNSSNRNQIPGYNLIRRAGLGEWIQFPLCLVHASNDFEMRIEMRILERDFIIFCRPSLNMRHKPHLIQRLVSKIVTIHDGPARSVALSRVVSVTRFADKRNKIPVLF